MNKKNIIITIVIIMIVIFAIIIGNLNKNNNRETEKLEIVTSFYPIYIMTLNITNGVEDVNVTNMAQNYSGCIHDYTLRAEDLKKFENADIFIENGYGMENFSQKIVDSYPNIHIIQAGKNITDLIKGENNEINAHFWTSIDNYVLQVQEITEQLKKIDNENSNIYQENATKYIEKLENLKLIYKEDLDKLVGKKVVSLNESFSYLLKSIGIKETLISTDHEQSSLSAEVIKRIIDEVNAENINCIIIGENDNDQNALTIKNETNAKIYKLKDGMTGDDSLDSYINAMKYNFEFLIGDVP